MTDGIPKALRVVVGILLMASFVLVTWAVLTRFAGGWGVPYFSFVTERGTPCRNDLTGYTCHQMTLPDVEFYADVDLPADTLVTASTYRATHDYSLEARLEVPAQSAEAALQGLNESFGPCRPGQPAPIATRRLSALCVMTNDDAVTNGPENSGRLYSVGTGLNPDGTRTVVMTIRSR